MNVNDFLKLKKSLRLFLTHAYNKNMEANEAKKLYDLIDRLYFSMEHRFETLEKKIDEKASQKSLDSLITTADYIVGRLSDIELETASRDAKVDRIYSWTEKSSAKLGIPLEYQPLVLYLGFC